MAEKASSQSCRPIEGGGRTLSRTTRSATNGAKNMAENTASLLDTWLQQSTDRLAPTTRRRYHTALLHFFTWYAQTEGRALELGDLHPITLVGYRGSLQEAAARGSQPIAAGDTNSSLRPG